MSTRAGKHGMGGYSWLYWAATVGAFAFLIVDLFDDGPVWNYAVIACIIVAIVVRPGGVWRRRPEPTPDDAAPRVS